MESAFGPGTTLLGKYRVERVVGRGGMGIVLRVTHLHLGEELAIKVLLPDGAPSMDMGTRFMREAQAAARLRGEHIARVIDVGVLPEGLPFMVMEYLYGSDLSQQLAQRKALPFGEAVDYVLQACEALAEAHAHGIIHRDIKPANLFLTARPDGTPLVKVLDFGISKAPIAHHALTRTDVVMGTAGYMSPEQMKASKDVDARTDIWALGVVLYECLCGRPPFVGESFPAVVLMAGTEPPPPMDPRIPRGLQQAVLRCLEKDRKARFASVAELVTAIVPFAHDRRAATTIGERVSSMLRSRPDATPVPGYRSGPVKIEVRSEPSTINQRGQLIPTTVKSPGRRVAVAVAVAIAGGIALAGLQKARSRDEVAVASRVVAAVPIAPAPIAPAPDAAVVIAPAPVVVDAVVEDVAPKPKPRAKPVVNPELRNAQASSEIVAAVRAGKLKDAQAKLKALPHSSVHFAEAQRAFDAANDDNSMQASKVINGLLGKRDCEALKAYIVQQLTASSGTDQVIGMAQSASLKCSEPCTHGDDCFSNRK